MNVFKVGRGGAAEFALLLVLALTPGTEVLGARNTFPEFTPFNGPTEGVAVDKVGNVYVSVRADSDQVWKLSPSGEPTLLAELGGPGGAVAGVAVDAIGNVYVAQAFQGVFRVTADGAVTQVPGTGQIVFPNALAFDPEGNLFVTETFSFDPPLTPASAEHAIAPAFGRGGIWCIPRHGTAELWLRDDLLSGLPPALFPFPVGANGIAFFHGALYVLNTDKALVLRIPVLPDGSPGQLEVWTTVEDVPESVLYGAANFPVMIDGLALDVHGNLYIAVVSRGAIVRIDARNRVQETAAVYPWVPLDTPASLAFGTGKGMRQHLFITNLGMFGLFVPDVPWPGPGLTATEAPAAGLPLP